MLCQIFHGVPNRAISLALAISEPAHVAMIGLGNADSNLIDKPKACGVLVDNLEISQRRALLQGALGSTYDEAVESFRLVKRPNSQRSSALYPLLRYICELDRVSLQSRHKRSICPPSDLHSFQCVGRECSPIRSISTTVGGSKEHGASNIVEHFGIFLRSLMCKNHGLLLSATAVWCISEEP